MDPIEVLELCVAWASEGAPDDLVVPRLFSAGEFEAMWRKDPKHVRRLLDELLCSAHADDGLELLMKSGALDALFPELVAIKNLGDDPASSMHKDVWDHSKKVVMGVPAIVELRWGALMHDIGKARTRKFDGRKVTFHNHDIVGSRMVNSIQLRLGLFNDDAALYDTVQVLVLNHLRPASYKKSWSDSGVRRLLVDIGGQLNFERLMTLSRADLTTKNPNKRDRALARARELEARVAEVYAADHAPKLPKGTMGIIIDRKVVPVGPALNVIRDAFEQVLRNGEMSTDRDAEWYATEGLELLLARGAVTLPWARE
jgi:poly(A) polymerase